MQITLVSLLVEDQERALRFYTEVLGFETKHDIPLGEYRWITVTSPEGVDGVELVLEPVAFPPAGVYQRALFEAGIPATAFLSKDIAAESARLQARGVVFRGEPITTDDATMVMFEDTCGNLIRLVRPSE